MKYTLSLIFLFVYSASIAQLPDKTIRDLKSGRMPDDTSYIYSLPWEKGEKYFFVQGSNSKFSHAWELALDFKMKKGSKVCAAREGVVAAMRKDSKKGGLKQENLSDGNYIIIKHSDGSESQYWHLETDGVFVNIGDSIAKGQVIGLSGNTGYSAFPHLHFQVFDGNGKQILTRFRTKKGNIYPRPGKWYKAI